MQEEVENRTVTLAISTTKMSANVLKSAISKYLAYCKEKKMEKAREGPVKPCGKQTVKQLVGQNQGVSNIEITDQNINSVIVDLEDRLMDMEIGPLFGLWFQSLFVGMTMWALI